MDNSKITQGILQKKLDYHSVGCMGEKKIQSNATMMILTAVTTITAHTYHTYLPGSFKGFLHIKSVILKTIL